MADTILHNQPTSEPSNDERIAFGTPSTPIGNITLANFYTLLMSKLSFFKLSNLFSEIPEVDKATARANLDVWKGSDISGAVNERALNTNVIRRNETVAFTPTIGTHPTNKKYVDDSNYLPLYIARVLVDGSVDYAIFPNPLILSNVTINRTGSGTYDLTIYYAGDKRNLKYDIMPSHLSFNTVKSCGIVRQNNIGAAKRTSFIFADDLSANDSDFEVYISLLPALTRF